MTLSNISPCRPYHQIDTGYESNGVNINQLDAKGNNALHIVCKEILQSRACNYKDSKNQSASLIKLISQGCNVTQRNYIGESPIKMIIEHSLLRDDEIIDILLPLSNSSLDEDLLHYTDSTSIAEYLVFHKSIPIDTLDEKGNNALITACKKQTSIAYLLCLVNLGCDFTESNRSGELPIVLFAKNDLLTDDIILTVLENRKHNYELSLESLSFEQDYHKDELKKYLKEIFLPAAEILNFTKNKKIADFFHQLGIAVNTLSNKTNTVNESICTLKSYIFNQYDYEIDNIVDLEKFGYPYHFAASKSDTQLIRLLYQSKVNINQVDENRNNALYSACAQMTKANSLKCLESIRELIGAGCDIHQPNCAGISPLKIILENCLFDDDEVISILNKLSASTLDKGLLHHVNSVKIAEYLLEKGAHINALDDKGKTPLCNAINRRRNYRGEDRSLRAQNAGLIKFLCDKGADLNLGLPFHRLAQANEYKLFCYLMNAGGNIEQTDKNGNTPLMTACESGATANYIVELINVGCDSTLKNHFGDSPIALIVKDKLLPDEEILALIKLELLENNDLLATTILHHTNSHEIIRLLVENDFPVDSFDNKGNTPLFLAVEALNFQKVELLLELGANPILDRPRDKQSRPILGGASSPFQLIKEKIDKCNLLYRNITPNKLTSNQLQKLNQCYKIYFLLEKAMESNKHVLDSAL